MVLVCYHGETPHKINQERANEILEVMTNLEQRKIINCIKNESKNVIQISNDTGITKSMTYRLLHELNEKKLVMLSGDINAQRRKVLKYKSKIRKIEAVVDGDVIDIRIYSNLRD